MDLAGRQALGDLPDPLIPPPPHWVVIGYPPDAGSVQVALETRQALAAGAAGVKLPVGSTSELTKERLQAALEAAGPGRVSLDLAWSQSDAESVARLVDGFELGWVEDPFQHGAVRELARLKGRLQVPLASGDEETHLHHPAHLVDVGAVDIIRMDATCMGGISAIERYRESAVDTLPVSWHMNPFWNSRAASIMPGETISIESSAGGSGVDPLNEGRDCSEPLTYPLKSGLTESPVRAVSKLVPMHLADSKTPRIPATQWRALMPRRQPPRVPKVAEVSTVGEASRSRPKAKQTIALTPIERTQAPDGSAVVLIALNADRWPGEAWATPEHAAQLVAACCSALRTSRVLDANDVDLGLVGVIDKNGRRTQISIPAADRLNHSALTDELVAKLSGNDTYLMRSARSGVEIELVGEAIRTGFGGLSPSSLLRLVVGWPSAEVVPLGEDALSLGIRRVAVVAVTYGPELASDAVYAFATAFVQQFEILR